MKIRKQRKYNQARLQYNKGWDWAFDNFIRKTVAHFKRFDQAMQEAFSERKLQQE